MRAPILKKHSKVVPKALGPFRTDGSERGVEDTTAPCILRRGNARTTHRFDIETAPRVAQEAMRMLEGGNSRHSMAAAAAGSGKLFFF
jgi:hypothetical protein